MNDAHTARWEERARNLGLDPARHNQRHWRLVTAAGLEDLTAKLGAPVLTEQNPTVAPAGPDAREAPDPLLRQAIVDHALGHSQITDRHALEEIATRYPEIGLEVLNVGPGPIVVTADKPLIINSSQSVVNFTKVTIEPGGYIEISVDCAFHATELVKSGAPTGATQGSPLSDITITGFPGGAGQPGMPGTIGSPGQPGTKGECDCCGGIAEKNGTDGAGGSNGSDGGQAGNGKPGGNGPTVTINIDSLASTVSLVNVGGRGGDGGVGGASGIGGAGGDGGASKQCGAEFCEGGSGGNGGDGGNGGNGGNSGDGGAGGNVVARFIPSNGSTMLVTNGTASPGTPGIGGMAGSGGIGGASGGRGGKPGQNGHTGQKPGANGTSGVPGRPGQVKVNPATA